MSPTSPDRILDRLTILAALSPGWHDGDGMPPTPEAIAAAREFALKAAPVSTDLRAYPTLEGGISLELHAAHGSWSIEYTTEQATIAAAPFHAAPSVTEPADTTAALASLTEFLAQS